MTDLDSVELDERKMNFDDRLKLYSNSNSDRNIQTLNISCKSSPISVNEIKPVGAKKFIMHVKAVNFLATLAKIDSFGIDEQNSTGRYAEKINCELADQNLKGQASENQARELKPESDRLDERNDPVSEHVVEEYDQEGENPLFSYRLSSAFRRLGHNTEKNLEFEEYEQKRSVSGSTQ